VLPSLTAGAADDRHPFAAGLRRVVAEVRAGSTVQAALDRWASRDPSPWSAAVVDACHVGLEMGVGLADALERVAGAARAESDLADDIRILIAPARSSAVLMVAMPLIFGAVVVLPDPELRAFLLGTPGGVGCVVVAAAAECVGAMWMRALVRAVR
jgi:tight adherence protein B